MIGTIADFAPDPVESGVGLAIQDDEDRFLFFLAGTRNRCPSGELFYAGIGGHREASEDWLGCAHREALEEIGTEIDVLPASIMWYIPHRGPVQQVALRDEPPLLALKDRD